MRCQTKVKDDCELISNEELEQYYEARVSIKDDHKEIDYTWKLEVSNFYQD